MKISCKYLLVCAALTLGAHARLHGAILYWDGSTPNNATTDGGTGVWNTANNWDAALGGANTSWGVNDDAIFGGTAGTVTVSAPVSAQSLTFNTTGYLVTGSTITLAGTNPSVTTAAGVTATLASQLAGSTAWTKAGTGTLVLSGANTYTAATTVAAGILNIQNATALGTTAAGTSVAAGATLQLQGGIAVGAEALTLNGTGVGGAGALVNVSGNNSWAGDITVDDIGGSTIASTAGTLTLSGLIQRPGGPTGNKVTPLVFTGDGNITITGVVGILGGAPITKSGAGTLSLSGTNLFRGALTVSAGVLNISNAAALGTTEGGTVISPGATLQLQGGIAVSAEALTLSGAGVGGAGAMVNVSGNNSWAGGITLDAGSTIASNAGTLTLSGLIQRNNGTTTLTFTGAGNIAITGTLGLLNGATVTKSGTGTLFLPNANLFRGTLDITGGVVDAGNSASLGDPTGGVNISAGAMLQLSNNIAVGAEDLSISGTGVGGAGAVRNVSGNNSWAGLVQLDADATIASDSGTLTLSGTVSRKGGGGGSGVTALTFAGAGDISVTGVMGLFGGGNITKTGAGTLFLSNANQFLGPLNINAGVVDISNSAALGGAGGQGTTVAAGATLRLRNNIAVATEAITLNGTGVGGTGALLNLSGANSISGPVTLASSTKIQVTAGSLTLSNTIAGASSDLTVDGAGDTTVSGIISGTGKLIKAGVGKLTLNGVNTRTGAVNIDGGVVSVATITNGGVAGSLGAATADAANLVFNGGTLQYTGATASSDRNYTLIAGTTGAVEVTNAATTLTLSGASAATTGNLVKTGAGALLLSGANAHTGSTTVSAGTLRLGASNALNTNTPVTVGAGATFDLNNFSINLGTVSGAGNITLGTATLTLGENDSTATLGGVISGAGGIVKTGGGTLTLAGANTFGGSLNVNQGAVTLTNSSAAGSTGAGTFVNSGASVQLDNGVAIGAEPLSLAGTGQGGNGALRSLSGSNSWAGNISLTADSTVAADAGTLTLSGTITQSTLSNFGLNFRGAGNISVTGAIARAGDITKSGTGRLSLSGNNTFAGALLINEGVVTASSSTALGQTGSAASRTEVASGAALELENNISIGTEALTLNGTGIGGTGALRNVSGINTYSGPVVLASDSEIQSDAGSLSFTGGISTGTFGLTVDSQSDMTFSAGFSVDLSGSGPLTKKGAGVLRILGSNSFTGATSVNEGALRVIGALTGSPLSVNSSGRLEGSGSVGTVTLNAGGAISPGTSGVGDTGTLNTGGNVTWNGGGVMLFDLGTPGTSDRLNINGALLKGSPGSFAFDFGGTGAEGAYTLVSATSASGFSASDFTYSNLAPGLSGLFSFSSNNLVFTVVPEPDHIGLAAAGTLAALSYVRRRQKLRAGECR